MNIDEKIKICEKILTVHEESTASEDRSYNEVSFDYIRANLITVLSAKLGIIIGNIDDYICKEPDDYDFGILPMQFDYICNNTSWEYFIFDESVFDIINAISGTEDETRELENLVQTGLSVLWDEDFKLSKVAQEFKGLIMDTLACIDSRLVNKKYRNLVCAALTTDSEYDFFNSAVCVLTHDKLKVLVENDLVNLDYLKPLEAPLLYYQFADSSFEEDYSLIAFEIGYGESGTLDMGICNSKLFVAMYYVELLSKKYEHLF